MLFDGEARDPHILEGVPGLLALLFEVKVKNFVQVRLEFAVVPVRNVRNFLEQGVGCFNLDGRVLDKFRQQVRKGRVGGLDVLVYGVVIPHKRIAGLLEFRQKGVPFGAFEMDGVGVVSGILCVFCDLGGVGIRDVQRIVVQRRVQLVKGFSVELGILGLESIGGKEGLNGRGCAGVGFV